MMRLLIKSVTCKSIEMYMTILRGAKKIGGFYSQTAVGSQCGIVFYELCDIGHFNLSSFSTESEKH
jgi:bacterioferritin-associated ferredoxin